jgi:2'-5' RNA ligase
MGTGQLKQQSFITPAETFETGVQRHAVGAKSAGMAERTRRAEYLLVIYPDGDLQGRLQDEQRQFVEDYDLRISFRNKPHITVGVFQAGEAMEATLLRWIQRICTRQQRFELTLINYSGFPPHTIYLRVQDPAPFRQLVLELGAIDDFVRSSGCPPMHLINNPYLSIAGSLTEQVYSRAMPDYARKTFHGSFRVGELVLLKRDHPFDPCKTVNVFHLSPEVLIPHVSSAWRLPKH